MELNILKIASDTSNMKKLNYESNRVKYDTNTGPKGEKF